MTRGRGPAASLAAVLLGWALLGEVSSARAETPNMSSWTRRAAEAWIERARASRDRGDTAQAITAYTEAVRVDPTFGAAYLELAEIRTKLGDTQQSEWLLGRAAALIDARERSLALLARSRLYAATGRAELALADLVAAVETEPTPSALRELGAFYLSRRAWVAALATYRRLALALRAGGSADELRDADTTLSALVALAREGDAAQLALHERGWIRAALRRHAGPAHTPQRGAETATRGGAAAARGLGASARKLAP